jgi:hypothetical protein
LIAGFKVCQRGRVGSKTNSNARHDWNYPCRWHTLLVIGDNSLARRESSTFQISERWLAVMLPLLEMLKESVTDSTLQANIDIFMNMLKAASYARQRE